MKSLAGIPQPPRPSPFINHTFHQLIPSHFTSSFPFFSLLSFFLSLSSLLSPLLPSLHALFLFWRGKHEIWEGGEKWGREGKWWVVFHEPLHETPTGHYPSRHIQDPFQSIRFHRSVPSRILPFCLFSLSLSPFSCSEGKILRWLYDFFVFGRLPC